MKKLFLLAMFPLFAHAWEPTKPVNVVMNMPAGSPSDNSFRIITAQVDKNTGVKFVPNYQLGAGGVIGNEFFVKTTPDGYNIAPIPVPGLTGTDRMVASNKSYTTNDFVYITTTASTPMTLIANINDPVNTIQEAVKVMKTEKTSVGDPGSGGRIAYELIRDAAKLEESDSYIARVTYKGPTEVVQDVANKNLRFGVVPLAAAAQMHIGKKIKIIGVTSETRNASFPDIHTFNSVYPGLVYNLSWALSVPKGTPADVIEWYSKEFTKALNSPEVQKLLQDNYFFIDKKLMTPKEMTNRILSDEKKFSSLVDRVIDQQKK